MYCCGNNGGGDHSCNVLSIAPASETSTREPDGLPPPNDSCLAATTLTVNGSALLGTNPYATALSRENCDLTFSQEAAVWYTFTFIEDVTPLQVSTCEEQNSFDTIVVVYSGGCNSLTCVGQNDDGAQGCASASALSFEATRGETYFVAVQGYDNAQGNFAINVESVGSGIACLCRDVITPSPSSLPQIQAPKVVPSSPFV